jgi:hypothetical protein
MSPPQAFNFRLLYAYDIIGDAPSTAFSRHCEASSGWGRSSGAPSINKIAQDD